MANTSVYYSILTAVRDTIIDSGAFNTTQVVVRKRPAYQKKADVLPLVVVSPETERISPADVQFGNSNIVDYPVNYLPLAKRSEKTPAFVEAFQLVMGGVEIVKAFSELNDPIEQRARLTKQEENKAAGDTEAQSLDTDFLEAMEHGMPPAGGVGIGIDRLVMLLTNTKNIKEVIFFPTLKPKN